MPSFLAINPQLFESVEHWSYRDLQKLARRLELSANGQRQELIERLREWHRDQRKTGQAGAFHSVEVRASVEGKPISPRLLSPLVVNRSQNGIMSPGRSPLKATTPRSNVLFSPVRARRPPTPAPPPPPPSPPRRLATRPRRSSRPPSALLPRSQPHKPAHHPSLAPHRSTTW